MDKLVGREQEIRLLKEYTSSDRPEFVAIYGRRRVGKTFLVNQQFAGKLAFSMTGVLNGTKTSRWRLSSMPCRNTAENCLKNRKLGWKPSVF